MPNKRLLLALCLVASFTTHTADYTNSIGMAFVKVPAGTFTMGTTCPDDDPFTNSDERKCAPDNEQPAHRVTISKPFYIGQTEVTQEQYFAMMGNNPSHFKARTKPVETVSWDDAQDFIKKLNEKEGCNTCYRLPTEAEWEYAARLDKASSSNAHYGRSYGSGSTANVASYGAGALGLYDILGNVWEWTADWYDKNYYSRSPSTDPQGPITGRYRMVRGGSWGHDASVVRSGFRYSGTPDHRRRSLGFRLLRTIP